MEVEQILKKAQVNFPKESEKGILIDKILSKEYFQYKKDHKNEADKIVEAIEQDAMEEEEIKQAESA